MQFYVSLSRLCRPQLESSMSEEDSVGPLSGRRIALTETRELDRLAGRLEHHSSIKRVPGSYQLARLRCAWAAGGHHDCSRNISQACEAEKFRTSLPAIRPCLSHGSANVACTTRRSSSGVIGFSMTGRPSLSRTDPAPRPSVSPVTKI